MRFISIFVLIILANQLAYTQNQLEIDDLTGGLNTITTAVPFLMITPDSRSGAMGDVGVATSPDASSLSSNPAKYSFIEDDIGFSISYVPWLRALVPDINLSYLSGYGKLNENDALGFELRYFSLGDITFTDILGNTLGQFNPNELALAMSYSRKLTDLFSLSIAPRFIYSNLTGGQMAGNLQTRAGRSLAADISGYYTNNIRFLKRDSDLSFGFNISNIGNKISYTNVGERDFIPINLKLGSSLNINFDDYNSMSYSFDINKLLVPTPPLYNSENEIIAGKDPNVSVVSGIFQSFSDAPDGFSEELREINLSFGTEYWYAQQFALRGGYFYEHDTKGGRKFFTFGAGVKYNVFALDFSYLINASRTINGTNPLANTMRFTMIFDIGALQQEGI
ncbi:type IX secretion system outer membrane channel protein PorV [Bacteroidota bacterium]|nr:type IX secretion system outer membrane channel protein PorV [Bacteroidota bacterium]MDC3115073.1 type IX secretion system outer membrane channel protein PorV [Bacteroidota bacterium]MDC3229917.1 type IX secretion system outer membrane channel protein PorV [Bacteroidota bacterium]